MWVKGVAEAIGVQLTRVSQALVMSEEDFKRIEARVRQMERHQPAASA